MEITSPFYPTGKKFCTHCQTEKKLSCFPRKYEKLKFGGRKRIGFESRCNTCKHKKDKAREKRNCQMRGRIIDPLTQANQKYAKLLGRPHLIDRLLIAHLCKTQDKILLRQAIEDLAHRKVIALKGWDVSLLEVLKTLDTQNFLCRICHKPERLYLDHDHQTNQFRGLICTHCNRGLGAFYDNPQFLQAAIDYLARTC